MNRLLVSASVMMLNLQVESCCTNADCADDTPICGPNNQCSNRRIIEPIENLDSRWNIDRTLWTKFVRAAIPVVGQEKTKDAAMFETAYFIDNAIAPGGVWDGVDGLMESMTNHRPTRVSVFPACPNAFMHPSLAREQSSGGGSSFHTVVTEDWILRYPKCVDDMARKCSEIPEGVFCNNCGWFNGDRKMACNDTLAHEWGHTLHQHTEILKPGIKEIIEGRFANPIERPAWTASSWYMNPGDERHVTRKNMHIYERDMMENLFEVTSTDWRYKKKDERCPHKGIFEPCEDSTIRTWKVPLDAMIDPGECTFFSFEDNDAFNQATKKWCARKISCPHISDWDTSRVTDMDYAFKKCTRLNSEDLSKWDVSQVTSMNYMFRDATNFSGDIELWDVSSVSYMNGMFYNAAAFNIDVSRWDVSSVTEMDFMFAKAVSFNNDISRWDVSSVTTMAATFAQAVSFNNDISRWDVSSVTTMAGMFYDAASFNSDISRWDVSNVNRMHGMFYDAASFNRDISRWDVSSVTAMVNMFYKATDFNGDVSKWDVSKVTNMMGMFTQATNFKLTHTIYWNTSAIEGDAKALTDQPCEVGYEKRVLYGTFQHRCEKANWAANFWPTFLSRLRYSWRHRFARGAEEGKSGGKVGNRLIKKI